MTTIASEHFKQALLTVLDETFDNEQGIYLDRGTSLFETLAGITAEEASIPVGGKCATLAAQVKHVAFYLDVVDQSVRDPNSPPVDWDEIWRTVSSVTDDQWTAIQAELRAANTPYVNTIPPYDEPRYPGDRELERRIKSLIRWNAMAMVVRANKEGRHRRPHLHLRLSRHALRGGLQPLLPRPARTTGGRPGLLPGPCSPGIYPAPSSKGRCRSTWRTSAASWRPRAGFPPTRTPG
jgi:hypothetical protein